MRCNDCDYALELEAENQALRSRLDELELELASLALVLIQERAKRKFVVTPSINSKARGRRREDTEA